jgi:hypothetical protein
VRPHEFQCEYIYCVNFTVILIFARARLFLWVVLGVAFDTSMRRYASKYEAAVMHEEALAADFQPGALAGSVWSAVWKDAKGEVEFAGLLRFTDATSGRFDRTRVRAQRKAPTPPVPVPAAATRVEWCSDASDASGRSVLLKGVPGAMEPQTAAFALDEHVLLFAADARSFAGTVRGQSCGVIGHRVEAACDHWTRRALESVGLLACAHVAVLVAGTHIPLAPMEAAAAAAEQRSWADSFVLAGGPETPNVGAGLREHEFLRAIIEGTGDGRAHYLAMTRACGGGGEENGATSDALRAVWSAVLKHGNAALDAMSVRVGSSSGGVPPGRLSRLWTRVDTVRQFLLGGQHHGVVQSGDTEFWSSRAKSRAEFLLGLAPAPSSARTLQHLTEYAGARSARARQRVLFSRGGLDHHGLDAATAVAEFVCDPTLSLPDLAGCLRQRDARAVSRAAALTTAAGTIGGVLAAASPTAQAWLITAVGSALRAAGGHPLSGVSGCTLSVRTKLTRSFGDFLAAMNRIVSREVCRRPPASGAACDGA